MKRRLVTLALGAGACVPALGSSDWLVTAPRILAVRASPAEAKPGAMVVFDALVVAPRGVQAGLPSWSFCLAPKPLTGDNVVSNECLDATSLRPSGDGASVSVATPSNGCSLFGPDTPAGGLRPRDPDPTGGYYQPLRVDLPAADPAFALARITCDLPDAPAATAAAFAKAYVPNDNPRLLPLAATLNGAAVSFASLPVGSHLDLIASWPADSAETYAYYDAASDTVSTKREGMALAWYASSGALDQEATGRADDDPATTSGNGWTAPTSAGTTTLWIVLRDSRGGVDFAVYQVTVVP